MKKRSLPISGLLEDLRLKSKSLDLTDKKNKNKTENSKTDS